MPQLNELILTGDGIAVVESGLAFGGGCLQNFGINSNTSANGFLKCLYRKKPEQNQQQNGNVNANNKNGVKNQPNMNTSTTNQANQMQQIQKSPKKKLKDMNNIGLEEGWNLKDEEKWKFKPRI
eukprot:403340423